VSESQTAAQTSVLREKAQLDDKRDGLISFFQTQTFEKLDQEDQDLLHSQMDAMTIYSYILTERISKF
tara:strand:- start:70 stop:273 length:204 start_codon:yes stop_codon:yes gene_type:complete